MYSKWSSLEILQNGLEGSTKSLFFFFANLTSFKQISLAIRFRTGSFKATYDPVSIRPVGSLTVYDLTVVVVAYLSYDQTQKPTIIISPTNVVIYLWLLSAFIRRFGLINDVYVCFTRKRENKKGKDERKIFKYPNLLI